MSIRLGSGKIQLGIDESLDMFDRSDNKQKCEFLHRVHWARGNWQENWRFEDMTAAIAGYFRDNPQEIPQEYLPK